MAKHNGFDDDEEGPPGLEGSSAPWMRREPPRMAKPETGAEPKSQATWRDIPWWLWLALAIGAPVGIADVYRKLTAQDAAGAPTQEASEPAETVAEASPTPTHGCGESPTLGAWDGDIIEVNRYMKGLAHDPGALDVENCRKPFLDSEYCWTTTCTVRGKNAFGAKVKSTWWFSIKNGQVVDANEIL